MLKFKVIGFLIFIVYLSSCNRQFSFRELTNSNFSGAKVKTYSSDNMKFNFQILERFNLVDRSYNDSLGFELFIDSTESFENGSSNISILKFKSKDSILAIVWKNLMQNRFLMKGFKIHSEGLTTYINNQESYYEHSTSMINNFEVESIGFLYKEDDLNFYLLNIQVKKDDNYPKNIRELLYCIKSFRTLDN